MRFFHISDLHLGLKLLEKDLLEDQTYILQQIVSQAVHYHIDGIVIAGDIYDKPVPPSEAVKVFDAFLTSLKQALPDLYVCIISGNHDAGQRVDVYSSFLKAEKIYCVGTPPEQHITRVDIQDEYGKIHFYLLPFIRPSMVRPLLQQEGLSYQKTMEKLLEKETIEEQDRNVFVSHQFYLPHGKSAEEVERCDSEIRTVGNIDEISADVLQPFDYAALGHIHKPMTVGKQIYRYCGTPIACSVSEAGQQKSILMVDMKEKGNTEITPIPLYPLRQVKVIKGTLEDILSQTCEDYVSVVLEDTKDHEVFELQQKLRHAFSNLLEVRRENTQVPQYFETENMEEKDTLTLCKEFMPDMDEKDMRILKSILNEVEEEV